MKYKNTELTYLLAVEKNLREKAKTENIKSLSDLKVLSEVHKNALQQVQSANVSEEDLVEHELFSKELFALIEKLELEESLAVREDVKKMIDAADACISLMRPSSQQTTFLQRVMGDVPSIGRLEALRKSLDSYLKDYLSEKCTSSDLKEKSIKAVNKCLNDLSSVSKFSLRHGLEVAGLTLFSVVKEKYSVHEKPFTAPDLEPIFSSLNAGVVRRHKDALKEMTNTLENDAVTPGNTPKK